MHGEKGLRKKRGRRGVRKRRNMIRGKGDVRGLFTYEVQRYIKSMFIETVLIYSNT